MQVPAVPSVLRGRRKFLARHMPISSCCTPAKGPPRKFFLGSFKVVTPAERQVIYVILFIYFLGGEQCLEKCWRNIVSGRRGAKNFSDTFWIVFRILFRLLSNPFSYRVKYFLGTIWFCRRATLRLLAHPEHVPQK